MEGREYAFVGIPATLPAGRTTFTFENIGAEEHEMGMVRLPEGLTVAEALQLPEEEAEAVLTFIGTVVAKPGAAGADRTLDLEAGRYGLVCFFENEQGPHAFQGMVAEFTVEP